MIGCSKNWLDAIIRVDELPNAECVFSNKFYLLPNDELYYIDTDKDEWMLLNGGDSTTIRERLEALEQQYEYLLGLFTVEGEVISMADVNQTLVQFVEDIESLRGTLINLNDEFNTFVNETYTNQIQQLITQITTINETVEDLRTNVDTLESKWKYTIGTTEFDGDMETVMFLINNIQSQLGTLDDEVQGGGGGSNVDLSNYITKDELDNYATKSEINNFVTNSDVTNLLNNYVTNSELTTQLQQALNTYVTNQQLTTQLNSITQQFQELQQVVNSMSSGGDVDLSNYYNKTEIDSLLTPITTNLTQLNAWRSTLERNPEAFVTRAWGNLLNVSTAGNSNVYVSYIKGKSRTVGTSNDAYYPQRILTGSWLNIPTNTVAPGAALGALSITNPTSLQLQEGDFVAYLVKGESNVRNPRNRTTNQESLYRIRVYVSGNILYLYNASHVTFGGANSGTYQIIDGRYYDLASGGSSTSTTTTIEDPNTKVLQINQSSTGGRIYVQLQKTRIGSNNLWLATQVITGEIITSLGSSNRNNGVTWLTNLSVADGSDLTSDYQYVELFFTPYGSSNSIPQYAPSSFPVAPFRTSQRTYRAILRVNNTSAIIYSAEETSFVLGQTRVHVGNSRGIGTSS